MGEKQLTLKLPSCYYKKGCRNTDLTRANANPNPSYICREHLTERSKQYRSTGKQHVSNRRYEAAHRERRRAWNEAQKIVLAACEVCGTTEKVHRHHDRPEMTLDVIMLCPRHHNERHARLNGVWA